MARSTYTESLTPSSSECRLARSRIGRNRISISVSGRASRALTAAGKPFILGRARLGRKRSPFLWKRNTAREAVVAATPETFDTSLNDMIACRKSVSDPYLSCTSAST